MLQKLKVTLALAASLGVAGVAHGLTMSEATRSSAPAPAAPAANSPWKSSVNINVFGQGLSDEMEESRTAGVGLLGSFVYTPADWMMADVTVFGKAEAGSSHALNSGSVPRNFFFPLNASIELRPVWFFAVEAGGISRRYLMNGLLMDIMPFPGVDEKLYAVRNKQASVWLQADQSIPLSTSLSTNSSQNEPLPTFFSQTLHATYTPEKDTTLKLVGGHWQFNQLPSQVAQDSQQYGNSVDARQERNARFLYQYQGWTGSASAEHMLLAGVTPKVWGSYLVNTEAPAGRNQGYGVNGQVKYDVSNEWSVTPRGEWFIVESDCSPAYYNLASFDFNTTGTGHNNRQGYSLEFKTTYEPNKIHFKGRYTDARLLEENPFQANTQIIFFSLELADVRFF